MRLFHGSPYGGLRDFRDFRAPRGAAAVFFTEDRHVAEDYARMHSEWSAASHSAFDPGTGGTEPTIYEVEIEASPDEVFDTRHAKHADLYQEFRRATRQEDPDDPAGGLLRTPTIEGGRVLLPPYSDTRRLFRFLGPSFIATWVSEGSQGPSLAVRLTALDRIHIVAADPLHRTYEENPTFHPASFEKLPEGDEGDDDYQFEVGGAWYAVHFEPVSGGYEISFRMARDASGRYRAASWDLTGTGNAVAVLATVMAIVRDFAEEREPDLITFTTKPEERFRTRLYRRFTIPGYEKEEHRDFVRLRREEDDEVVRFTFRREIRRGSFAPPTTRASRANPLKRNPTFAPLPYELLPDDGGIAEYVYRFVYGGEPYLVEFEPTRSPVPVRQPPQAGYAHETTISWIMQGYAVSFHRERDRSSPEKYAYGMTGEGGAVPVLGTVMEIMRAFAHDKRPEFLLFTAEQIEPSRVRLYEKLTRRMNVPGYVEGASRTRYGDAAQFYLVRADAIEERNARRKQR